MVLTNETKGYLWGYHSCDPGNRFIIFEYANTREGEVVNNRLDDYQGILQTDGYNGYNKLRKNPQITSVGCWAHCRRKYMEIVKVSKTTGKAHQGLSYISKLYQIEAQAKGLTLLQEKIYARKKQNQLSKNLKPG